MANHAIKHTFWDVLYIPTAWVSLCSFTCLAVVGLESRTSRSKIPRFSFVVNKNYLTNPILGYSTDVMICIMAKKGILVASLVLNVLLITCISGAAYNYKEKIIVKLEKIAGKYNSPSEKDLANFNNDPLGVINDSLMIGADSTITCLFLGNSLTLHDVIDEEPAEGLRGLTSTRVDNDYVHVLLKTISKNKHVNIKYSITNISQFERTFTKYSFEMGKLALAENKQPDYLFVQIGENVAAEDVKDASKYEEEYIKLLGLFPKAQRIITLPFWPRKDLAYATTDIAIKSNSYLVDISHLGDGTDPMNFSSSYKNYKMPGVGAHPGDYGMANIANSIYAVFNAINN